MTARGTARLLAAALIVAGIQMNTMYHRINDLECQRDIYKSRSESWEREASGWHDVTMQLGELTDDLREELKSKEQSLPANFTMEYAGDFLCTSYCTVNVRVVSAVMPNGVALDGDPAGTAGNIIVTDKLLNGFKIAYTGNAKEVTLEVEVQGGMIPVPEYEDGVAPTGEEGV